MLVKKAFPYSVNIGGEYHPLTTMQTLEVRMTHTLAILRRNAVDMGAWSLDRSGYSYAEIADAVSRYEDKLNQLERLRSIGKRETLDRSDYLAAHKVKQQHRSQVALERNRAKRDRKRKRQDYRVYKEHSEGQDKRDRQKLGIIGWAVLCVGNSSIATNLRRRLESALSDSGRLTSEKIDQVFWVVGGSESYRDAVVSRIAHLIDPPRDFTACAEAWNQCKDRMAKEALIESWNFSTDELQKVRDLAGTLRRAKRCAS
jgi:hypothetical protein